LEKHILSVNNIHIRFGGIKALDGVSFEMAAGSILGLIGPNGAGKTTLFNCLSRLYSPDCGDILVDGRSILSRSVHRIAEVGIGRTFQNIALFHNLSVLDNVLVGTHWRAKGDFFSDGFYLPWTRRSERAARRWAIDLINYLDLGGLSTHRVADLPFGSQKRVELARALATNPRLLLLDEPACGLNHEEVEQLGALIRAIRKDLGISILLVEHHMNLVMAISDSIVALNFGRKIGQGTPREIRAEPEVIAAYLGAQTA
jgi:branched-chain amino acid transport system ATP-binding protein